MIQPMPPRGGALLCGTLSAIGKFEVRVLARLGDQLYGARLLPDYTRGWFSTTDNQTRGAALVYRALNDAGFVSRHRNSTGGSWTWRGLAKLTPDQALAIVSRGWMSPRDFAEAMRPYWEQMNATKRRRRVRA